MGRRIYLQMYFTRRLPVVQNLDFCLIGRKTNDPSPEALQPIGQATYLTFGAIRWVLLSYGHLRLFMTETTR